MRIEDSPHATRSIAVSSAILVAAILGCKGSDTAAPPPPVTGALPVLASSLAMPANYGIHDTFVRDGIAFVCVWNSGVMIFDVGNGIQGGSPANPVSLSTLVTSSDGVAGGPAVHNAWWFWNPVTSEKKYLFIGQEGPGQLGSGSSGDIHVVDVSDLTKPAEVAFFHLNGAGTHNFWLDESAQILYAAYYNQGVVALDVSGTLSGDLATRLLDSLRLGGVGNTYTWGVQLYQGSLYAIDMLTGFWQLGFSGGKFSVRAGGHNVAERYSSDLGVQNGYGYTGTWGSFLRRTGNLAGNAVKIWRLNPVTGAPALQDSIITDAISTVSDIKVSPDGKLLMFSTEGGSNAGFWFYSLKDPANRAFVANYLVATGVHTAKFAAIGGRLYAFGAKDPPNPALLILDLTALDQ